MIGTRWTMTAVVAMACTAGAASAGILAHRDGSLLVSDDGQQGTPNIGAIYRVSR